MTKAIVVLSGGQDSVTSAFWALKQPDIEVVGVVHFRYGQRHEERESLCVERFLQYTNLSCFYIDVRELFGVIGNSALTNSIESSLSDSHPINSDLPASFVPCRNLLFLTSVAGLAYRLGATQIITGVNQVDYSGYPDCRRETIDALEMALNYGLGFGDDVQIEITTPLIYKTKAEIFELAEELGVLDYILEHTWTGYEGASEAYRYDWGWGPAANFPELGPLPEESLDPASRIRAEGYRQYLEKKS